MPVTIREYEDFPRGKQGGYIPEHGPSRVLVTDSMGLPIKVVANPGTSDPLEASTHVVELESTAATRYAITPPGAISVTAATANHNLLPANTPTLVAVRPGSRLNFL